MTRLTDSADALLEDHIPPPQPGRDELLVRVCAAGVTPSELLWHSTSHSKKGEERTGAIPAHEFSGVIAAVGEQITGFNVARTFTA